MKVKFTNPRLTFSIIFLIFSVLASAQEANNERFINPSSIISEKNDKTDIYNYKYENALISIFKEEEGIEDIYQVEKDFPKIDQKMDFKDAEIKFINEINAWITENKTKYTNAFTVITKELNK